MFFSRRFLPFMTTLFFGAFNDNMFRNALVILITYQSQYGAKTAGMLSFLAMALLMLPYFPFSATAGELADRFPRRRLFIITKIVELLLMCGTAAALFYKNIPLLLALIFLMGTQSAFFSPLKYSYIPQMLPRNVLLRANAYVNAGTYLAIILGAVAGNYLIIGADGTVFTGIALIVTALIGAAASFAIPAAAAVNPRLKISRNCAGATMATLRLLLSDRTMRCCAIGLSSFWMVGALYVSQLAPFCRDVLNAAPDLVVFFYLLFSCGVAVGSLLCGRVGNRVMGWLTPALLLMAVFTLDLYFASRSRATTPEVRTTLELLKEPGFIRMTIDLFMSAVCGGFYSVPLNALLQRAAFPEAVARVVAGNNVLNSLAIAVGTLLTGLLLGYSLITLPGVFAMVGGINMLTGLYLYRLRRIKI
ncbi:MAG: MFS transporter [Victivallaceae bacterium]|nr:MFS transporter [Victivallaceae bacterium]